MRRVLLIALVLLSTACRRRPPPENFKPSLTPSGDPPPATAPSFAWKAGELSVDGQPNWHVEISYGVKGEVSASLLKGARWPSGSKLIVGTEEQPMNDNIVKFKTTVFSALGTVAVWRMDLAAKDGGAMFPPTKVDITPKIPLKVRFSNGVELVTVLPPGEVLHSVIDHAMESAAKEKGLTFDDEPARAPASHSIYYMHEKQSAEVFGTATTMNEVDWLAVATSTYRQTGKTCSFTSGKLPLDVETQTITLVDRKTHATIDTTTLVGEEGCPSFAIGNRATVGPGREAVKKWALGVAKAHP